MAEIKRDVVSLLLWDIHSQQSVSVLLQSVQKPQIRLVSFQRGIDKESLLQAVDTAVEMNQNDDLGIPVPDYVEENVSDKVVKIIQSYTGVVNKMVWRKF